MIAQALVAALVPAAGLPAGHVDLTFAGAAPAGFAAAVEVGLGAGFAAGAAWQDAWGGSSAQAGNFKAGRLSWTPPWPGGLAIVLSAGQGRYLVPGSNPPGAFPNPAFGDYPFWQPALAWGGRADYGVYRTGWRVSAGPVLGFDGRPWLLPVQFSDVALIPSLPIAINAEWSWGLGALPGVDLVVGGQHGPGLGLRVRL